MRRSSISWRYNLASLANALLSVLLLELVELVALAVLLAFIGPLTADGNQWWLWTCVTGIALGLIGILYTNWRHK